MQQIIDSIRARRATRSDQPPRSLEEIRAGFALVGGPRPLPEGVVQTAVDAGGAPAHWLTTPESDAERILLYVHGGGYTLGSLRSHGPLAAELGRTTRRQVLFPEYRLAPEHPFPAAVDDIQSVWRWLTTLRGARSASVLMAGDSAGGGLILGLLHALRDTRAQLPAGAVLISPLLDLTASGASILDQEHDDLLFTPDMIRALAPAYLADADPRTPAASPLFSSQAGLPPLLIQVGGAELLLSDSERLAETARRAGSSVELHVAAGLPHVFHGALGTPEAAAAIDQIAGFDQRLPT
jgi:monoterpene epsilon-lactone hydrolase